MTMNLFFLKVEMERSTRTPQINRVISRSKRQPGIALRLVAPEQLKKLLKYSHHWLEIVFRQISPFVIVDRFVDHPLLAIAGRQNLVARFLQSLDLGDLLFVIPGFCYL